MRVRDPGDEAELIARATRAYRRLVARVGGTMQEPSRWLSGVRAGRVIVANERGILAQYRICPSGRLLRVAPGA